ncbi:hypothetical protein LMH87_004406 [Akanthomyces muscarius]|uniref:Aprataxin-like protein n=1 Tax=Akanthomyces muscarius TaxID=2231603 RepID=A0A9W8UHL7_AKAMU|nr:hypothetical protein LMH87_004406 [Akanthomyces muscarius]KAJ4145558.1 hypothetical protein LMH87_004406 [Akanthomyces muscarius]
MADAEPSAEEGLTKEEIQSASEAPPAGEKRKNAFAALMAPKKKQTPAATPARSAGGNPFKDRMGLGAYLGDPAAFSASVVIAHSPDFVVIHDKFPKSTVHTLILPRSPAANLLHPFDALADPALLASVKAQVLRTKALVAAELQRQLGRFSASEAARQAVLDGEAEVQEGAELPRGRDWAAEVVCGVHAVPSMSHVHVHVLSRDMHSRKVKHRKHYNSFTTPFLVDVEDFPLAEDDPRRDTKRMGYLQRDLRCWRCGRNFGNKFAQLKEHLEQEFDAWKRE